MGRAVAAALIVLAALLSAGCASYRLQGKVIEGGTPAVLVVEKDDPRLNEPGIAGTVLEVTIDPNRLSASDAGADVSDLQGEFAIPIGEFGAGLLEYDARVIARLRGYQTTNRTIRLPGSNKRLLVILSPGQDNGSAPAKQNVIDETLKWSEPYLN